MENSSIVEFIKRRYPKVVFQPIRLNSGGGGIGFVLSNSRLVVGVLKSDGTLCKVVDPIDLSKLGDSITDVIGKIPTVEGFSQVDKDYLLGMVKTSNPISDSDLKQVKGQLSALMEEKAELENQSLVWRAQKDDLENKLTNLSLQKSELEDKLKTQSEQLSELSSQKSDIDVKYNQLRDEFERGKDQLSKYTIMFDSKNQEFLAVKKDYEDQIRQLREHANECAGKIMEQHDKIRDAILQYRQQWLEHVRKLKQVKDEDIQKLREENEGLRVALDGVRAAQSQSAQSVAHSESLEGIRMELEKTREELEKTLETKRCVDKLMGEKQQIIDGIRVYHNRWMTWSDKIKDNFSVHKRELIAIGGEIEEKLKYLGKESDHKTAKDSVESVRDELKKVISAQLIKLNKQEEEIALLKSVGAGFVINAPEGKNEEVERLKAELEMVRKLLVKNGQRQMNEYEKMNDYETCYSTLQSFFMLNNVFYRRREVINKLDGILSSNTNPKFSAIQEKFNGVKARIEKHIDFLDLERYTNSPYFQYLKSKATRNKVPAEFCEELKSILDYWNANRLDYNEQDRILSGIYEDISSAVRVYIRIKPLMGAEQKKKAVMIKPDSQQLYIKTVCNSKEQVFGDFYGAFGESSTNVDIFTGMDNTLVLPGSMKVDTNKIALSGLYNVFRQVEDGYSIVLFGYGGSGAGKTFTLLGGNGVPGVIEYGLTNLSGVKNIKVKYVFEQYMASVDVQLLRLSGKIYNLVREVPQLREFSVNENDLFAQRIGSSVRLDSISPEDMPKLTQALEDYRKEHGRIKNIPSNPESSRSHLYIVFEVRFESGQVGYITVVDMAGRESPMDTLNMYYENASLGALFGNAKLKGKIDVDDGFVKSIVSESIYINETLNHLTYFFNKKGGKQMKVLTQPSDITKYGTGKFFVMPFEEDSKIGDKSNCLTIPILGFLDGLGRSAGSTDAHEWKPTKFLMMCNVRQEYAYCDGTIATLEFAQSLIHK